MNKTMNNNDAELNKVQRSNYDMHKIYVAIM